MADNNNKVLDLTGAPDRPTVKLPSGDHAMRVPEELTFDEFARQTRIGKMIMSKAEEADDPDVLEELQVLVSDGAKIMLIDLDDDDARLITPGMFLKISAFFRRLGDEIGSTPSETGTNSPDGCNDSSEEDQATA